MMKTRIALTACVVAAFGFAVGCGQHATSPAPTKAPATTTQAKSTVTADKAAVTTFIHKQNAIIQQINQGFMNESKLFEQVSTKQIAYGTFQKDYSQDQSGVQSKVNQLAKSSAPSGAQAYQTDYVALMQDGLKVFADQEKAILPDRTVDKSRAATLKQELASFVQQSQQLSSKYGVK